MSGDHAKTKEDLGLSRVTLLRNTTYRPRGIKAYASLLARHGFTPTKPGPYCYRNRMHQRGLANIPGTAGGRVRMERVLMKNEGAEGGSVKPVTADDQCSDAVYLCEVGLGTPAQKLKLEFNTGSSELWVCAPGQSLGSDSPGSFDPERPTSYQSMKTSWMVKGGDGSSASGGTGIDQVSLGGLQVKEQVIQLATRLEGHPAPRGADGCLGLSIPKTKTITENGVPDPQDTLIANLMSRSEVPTDAQVFTAVLDRAGDGKNEAFCTFGHIDHDTLRAADEAGGISWAAVDGSKEGWAFQSEEAGVRGSTLMRAGNMAVADSSSPLILVGDDVCEAFYGQIKGTTYSAEHQGWLVPRSTEPSRLPELRLAVGEARVQVDAAELLFSEAGLDHWYGALQSRGDNARDILGQPFLRSIHAIWDYGNGRFGCVPRCGQ